jgi:hypothetical protein
MVSASGEGEWGKFHSHPNFEEKKVFKVYYFSSKTSQVFITTCRPIKMTTHQLHSLNTKSSHANSSGLIISLGDCGFKPCQNHTASKCPSATDRTLPRRIIVPSSMRDCIANGGSTALAVQNIFISGWDHKLNTFQ